MGEVHGSVLVSKVGLSWCEVEGEEKGVVGNCSRFLGHILLPYQESPVCRIYVDWNQEEVAI